MPLKHLCLYDYSYLTYKTVNYSSTSIKISWRWLFWKNLMQSRSGHLGNFKLISKFSYMRPVSRLSFLFLWLCFNTKSLCNAKFTVYAKSFFAFFFYFYFHVGIRRLQYCLAVRRILIMIKFTIINILW